MNFKSAFLRCLQIMRGLIATMAIGAANVAYPSPLKEHIDSPPRKPAPDWSQPSAPREAPNIVIILLDDVGYAASEIFGGPVQMPKLAELARGGLRYNRFHVPAICSATRAALLSGRNDHQAGFGLTTNAAKGFPGYNSIWPKSVAPVSEVLRQNGYSTAAFGKWHNTPEWEINPLGPFDRWPTGLGFEYFYGSMSGFDSQWQPARLYRNTTAIDPPRHPEEGYHFTTDITDQAISWLNTLEALSPDKPYLLYFATGATHAPFQVPREWTDRYKGKFDRGWDKLREQIFARQKKLGIIPDDAKLTPRPGTLPAWEDLSEDQKKVSAREMEVFAGFLTHTDHEVGRLMDAVRRGPRAHNTLIIYIVGDNGASGMPTPTAASAPEEGWLNPNTTEKLKRLDTLGTHQNQAFISYSDPWAWATNTPFQWTKFIASHFGGTRVPMIISWPNHTKDHGSIRSQFTHANDVAATLYDVTGIEFPQQVNGIEQIPLAGVSFAYTLNEPRAPSRHRTQIFEQAGNRAIYYDGWVAASKYAGFFDQMKNQTMDFNSASWELYHIDQDFSQAMDLASKHPDKLDALKKLFDTEAKSNNIYPLVNYFDKSLERPAEARREYVYRPPLPRIPGLAMPDLTQSSYTFTADVLIPESGAQGVVFFYGDEMAGFTLYIKDDHLVYESKSSYEKNSNTLISRTTIPRGKTNLTLIADKISENSVQVKMYINEKPAGNKIFHPTLQDRIFSSFITGKAILPSFTKNFEPPYEFSGTVKKVHLKIHTADSISLKSSQ